MFSKLFTLSTLLGLLVAMPATVTSRPAKAKEMEVVVGGPGGLIQYSPYSVVGVLCNLPS